MLQNLQPCNGWVTLPTLGATVTVQYGDAGRSSGEGQTSGGAQTSAEAQHSGSDVGLPPALSSVWAEELRRSLYQTAITRQAEAEQRLANAERIIKEISRSVRSGQESGCPLTSFQATALAALKRTGGDYLAETTSPRALTPSETRSGELRAVSSITTSKELVSFYTTAAAATAAGATSEELRAVSSITTSGDVAAASTSSAMAVVPAASSVAAASTSSASVAAASSAAAASTSSAIVAAASSASLGEPVGLLLHRCPARPDNSFTDDDSADGVDGDRDHAPKPLTPVPKKNKTQKKNMARAKKKSDKKKHDELWSPDGLLARSGSEAWSEEFETSDLPTTDPKMGAMLARLQQIDRQRRFS